MNSGKLATTVVAPLFQPFRLKGLALSNRIVMAPMTRRFSPGGVPGLDVAAYYRRRAEGGVGLIVTEGTVIDHPAAASSPAIPCFHGDAALAGWRRVVEAVHGVGGRIMPQLWHMGLGRKPGDGPNPEVAAIGPSGLYGPDEPTGRAMIQTDIDQVIDGFGKAAEAALRLGFDGIELHGAHGYLIDQFFWAGTNRRTDRYGGDITARVRFGTELVAECRRRTGPNFPIVLRISQWKLVDYGATVVSTPDELAQWLAPLAEAGVDAFHCSQRRFWEPAFAGSPLNLAGWAKRLTGLPSITVGSVGLDQEFIASIRHGEGARPAGLDRLVAMLERGEFDLVAVGRALIGDATWADKVRRGADGELKAYDPAAQKVLV